MCTTSEIEDCKRNCVPNSWLGDGFCDDGSYSYNGVDIDLDCIDFNNDDGDCPQRAGGQHWKSLTYFAK